MKKLITIFIAVVFCFVFAFTGCGGSSGGGSDVPNSTDSEKPADSENSTDSTDSTESVEPIPENKKVGEQELIETLMKSPYKAAIENADYGLSDASIVGANEQAFTNILYPIPENFDNVYVAADYGITKDGDRNERNLDDLLVSLKDVDGLKKIVFESGTYTFAGTIDIKDVQDVYFVGDNTDFVFSVWCVGYNLRNSKNIHFNGISTDYNPSPVVAGVVANYDLSAKSITIDLDDEFDLSNKQYNGGVINYGSYMEFTENDNGDVYPNPNGNLLYNSTGDGEKSITGGTYNKSQNQLTLKFTNIKEPKIGDKVSVAFTMYEYATFDAKECENIYFEGCNIYCSAGMTFMFHTVTNTYLNRTNLKLKEGSARLMTATADGFHGNDCCGDIVITGSIFENSHDDSINICSFYKNIASNAARKIVCESSSMVTNFPINVGDEIEIYDPATFEFIGKYKVTEVSNSLLKYTISVNKMIFDDLSGKIIGNVTRNPKVRINDCIFRNKRNRGILLQSRDSDISNNTFENIVHGSISLHSALDIFAEAIVPGGITVKNNKFINNNMLGGLGGEIAVFAHGKTGSGHAGAIKNITVENNFMAECFRHGIYFNSAGESVIKNNLIFNPKAGHSAVNVNVSEGITVEDNCALLMAQIEDYGIVKTDESPITQKNNILKILGE